MENKEIVKILYEIKEMLEINSVPFKPRAYEKAALSIEKLEESIDSIYKREGIKSLKKISGVGESIAKKIEEYLKKGEIKYYQELKEKTAIRSVVAYFFKTKNISLDELKMNARKEKIIYSRFTKPAKQLLVLTGSLEKAKEAMNKVAEWANSRGLDYTIETVFKKFLELDRLKPKEIVKKPYYLGDPMVWSDSRKKWYVISPHGEWLEFAAKEQDIEWRIEKPVIKN